MELGGNLKTQQQNIIVKRFKISIVSVNYILVTSISLTLTPLLSLAREFVIDTKIMLDRGV